MTILIWLAASSLVWGAVIWAAGLALQQSDISGRARQWIWRGAAMLLVAPWVAVPLVRLLAPRLSLSLAPAPVPETTAPITELPLGGVDTGGFEPAIPLSATTFEPAGFSLPWIELLVAALVTGWISRLVLTRLAAARMRRLVQASSIAPQGPSREALNTWSKRLSLRRSPDLRLTAQGVSPFSFGALKPVICLPEGIERQMQPEALNLIVGHECIHVARGDGWLRPAERFIADLMWFNPFAWRIRRELDLARELACDEAVVEASAAPKSYARTLRDVAKLVSGLSPAAPAASMSLSGGGRMIAMRMKRTLTLAKRRSARTAVLGAIVLALAGAPIALAQAVLIEATQPDEPQIAPPAPPVPPVPVAAPTVEVPEAPPAPRVPAGAAPAIEVPEAPPAPAVPAVRPELPAPPAPIAVPAPRTSAELEVRVAEATRYLAETKGRFEQGIVSRVRLWDAENALAMAEAAIADTKAGNEPGKGVASAEARLQAATHRAAAAKLSLADSRQQLSAYDDAVAMAQAAVADAKAGSEPGKGVATAEVQLQIALRQAQRAKELFDMGAAGQGLLSSREGEVAFARARLADLKAGRTPQPTKAPGPLPAPKAMPVPQPLKTPNAPAVPKPMPSPATPKPSAVPSQFTPAPQGAFQPLQGDFDGDGKLDTVQMDRVTVSGHERVNVTLRLGARPDESLFILSGPAGGALSIKVQRPGTYQTRVSGCMQPLTLASDSLFVRTANPGYAAASMIRYWQPQTPKTLVGQLLVDDPSALPVCDPADLAARVAAPKPPWTDRIPHQVTGDFDGDGATDWAGWVELGAGKCAVQVSLGGMPGSVMTLMETLGAGCNAPLEVSHAGTYATTGVGAPASMTFNHDVILGIRRPGVRSLSYWSGIRFSGAWIPDFTAPAIPSAITSGLAPKSADPAKAIPVQLVAPIPAAVKLSGAPNAVLEVPSLVISGFGYRSDPFTNKTAFHEGVDLNAEVGTPVHAPAPGIIAFAGEKGTYGRVVELALPDNRTMRFGHLNEIKVKTGDEVKAGEIVGTTGATGRTSVPGHLHLEYYYKGKAWDPAEIKGLKLASPATYPPGYAPLLKSKN